MLPIMHQVTPATHQHPDLAQKVDCATSDEACAAYYAILRADIAAASGENPFSAAAQCHDEAQS